MVNLIPAQHSHVGIITVSMLANLTLSLIELLVHLACCLFLLLVFMWCTVIYCTQ